MKQPFIKTFMSMLSLGISFALIYYLYTQISGKGGILGGADKFKPTLNTSTRFSDVQGVTEAKDELIEVVEFLKDPSKFNKLGGKLPRGVLLTGPPGTGKTLLAKAVAGEAGVPFFYASGSEFEEMYVGVGAKRVRELFAAAKTHAPCIIFIDEIDAIGGARNAKDHQAMRMTMNQLLTELDGFNGSSNIIVMGATNFPSILDKALLRPGRFDRHVVVGLPDQAGRTAMLNLHIAKNRVPIAADVNTQLIARGTPGSSGADLANIVNLAAVRASIAGRAAVTHADFEHAKDRSLMGAERASMTMTEDEKRLTAFHEGGHALVALKTAGAQPVHKATILPRGQALGFVLQLPERDQYSINRTQLLAKLDVAMGGRIAEELMFGPDNVTTGATSDMQQATRMASDMVLRYGMCEDSIGLVYRTAEDYGSLSEQAKLKVDAEVRRLLDQSYTRTRQLLDSNRAQLTSIADALMSYETLTGAELAQLMRGDPLTHRLAGTSGSSVEEMYNAPSAAGANASRNGGAVTPVPAHHSEQKDGSAQGGEAL